ncbi:MAG: hypothetical protein ABSA33_05615, partial [Candidatus Micrarchaeaceae archaeon]
MKSAFIKEIRMNRSRMAISILIASLMLLSSTSRLGLELPAVHASSGTGTRVNSVQGTSSTPKNFLFNNTGLFWTGAAGDMMKMKPPTLTIATTHANCTIPQTMTSSHNLTTYIYSFAGALACPGSPTNAPTIDTMKLYVDNTSNPLSREIIVSGTVIKPGSQSVSVVLSMPLVLPANV